jgi:hypothetical protein
MQIQTGTTHKTRKVNGNDTLIWSEDLREDLTTLANITIQYTDRNITNDNGTCFLGGGICVDVVIGNKRTSSKMVFIEAPFYGNESSFKALTPVLDYINEYYPQLNAYYYEGRID